MIELGDMCIRYRKKQAKMSPNEQNLAEVTKSRVK